MKKTKIKHSFAIILFALIFIINGLLFFGCNINKSNQNKGKFFVSSEYIIATASLTTTSTSSNGETTYGIDISHESDIKLNYLSYKCELYYNNTVIETFKGEVPMNGLYSRYIPLKTTKKYDHAKVICTGYSDEDPKNFVRLNAMPPEQMKNCQHKNLITATIKGVWTNSKNDYIKIEYSSTTAFGDFRFFYENYQYINFNNAKVCVDCGFFEELK